MKHIVHFAESDGTFIETSFNIVSNDILRHANRGTRYEGMRVVHNRDLQAYMLDTESYEPFMETLQITYLGEIHTNE